MDSILRPTLHKIPGGGMPVAPKEKHAKDLPKLTRGELLEVKERQEHLLSNKSKLARLPDKGKRIQDFYVKVQAELERRDVVNEAADMFSVLNIASKGHAALNKLEWQGRLSAKDLSAAADDDPAEDVLDSDDELEMDPLRIIAQRQMHERCVRVLPAALQLITAADLAEIETFAEDAAANTVTNTMNAASASSDVNFNEVIDLRSKLVAHESILNGTPYSGLSPDTGSDTSNSTSEGIDLSSNLAKFKPILQPVKTILNGPFENENSPVTAVEQHVRYVVEKTELIALAQQQRERFKPYKTTISNVHDPDKERARKKGKHWENTAATPPLIEHSGAQLLTLLDSVDIQTNYLSKLKDLQEKQATDRLAAKMERLELRKLTLPNAEELKANISFTAHRSQSFILRAPQIEGDPRFNEVEEVHDPLDEEKPGGIIYTVFD